MMESLSPEARALYDLLKADTREEYEARFLQYKKESLDAVKVFVDETTAQLKAVNLTVEGVRSAVGADLDTVKTSLSADIANLAATVDRALHPPTTTVAAGSTSTAPPGAEVGAVGPDGHRDELHHRGMPCARHMPSPVGGNFSDRSIVPLCARESPSQLIPDGDSLGPRVELPQFDGANPKLWQRRSEEYFTRWRTQGHLWVSYASSLFVGDAATWLEAYLHQNPRPSWTEFVAAVITRFGRNQHQVLVRRMFHICQTSTVVDYVHRFAQLMDQIAAYELHPDPVHYTTRFLDGLKPAVRVLVAIQQPPNLDTAYSLALLYEELGDSAMPIPSTGSTSGSSRRYQQVPVAAAPPPPPAKWISRTVEEKRLQELARPSVEDKWTNLKAYRRSKGLCFVCGERWSKEHQCKAAIQLHVVQEMVDYLQSLDSSDEEEPAGETHQQTLVSQVPQQ
jgi:hypothetical protein